MAELLAGLEDVLQRIVTAPWFLWSWSTVVTASLVLLIRMGVKEGMADPTARTA